MKKEGTTPDPKGSGKPNVEVGDAHPYTDDDIILTPEEEELSEYLETDITIPAVPGVTTPDLEDPADPVQEEPTQITDDILTGHDFTQFEVDPDRKEAMAQLGDLLPDESKESLMGTLTRAWEMDSTVLSAQERVENLIQKMKTSKVLQARNQAADETLNHYHQLAARVSTLLNDGLNDRPLSSLKIDGIKAHVRKINTDLTILSGAIHEMADMLNLNLPEPTNPDQPIDVDALVKVITVVACGTKTWAATYSEATKQIKILQSEISILEKKVETFEEEREEARLAKLEQDERDRRSILSRGNWFAVMDGNGQFVSTLYGENEDGDLRISPATFTITRDREEAATFPTIDDAREVLDALRHWSKVFPSVRKKLNSAGMYPDRLFIAESTLKKVEG